MPTSTKPKSKRASYREAVSWIALNDSAADLLQDTADTIAGYLTVALVADIFGKDRMDVARDVMRAAREMWA